MTLSTIHYGISLIILVINVALFVAIKFNDLKHLGIAMTDLKETINKHGDKIDGLSERISRMEGIITSKPKRRRKTNK